MIGPGSRLAHYEIVAALGKGGMGEVWRARDAKLGREVAIKTLPPEFANDPDRLARFEREAKLLASLNHPNIAAIYGLEEHDGSRFLVLELVEGDTLADRLKRGAIPAEESLNLALQIAEAFEAAHEKGVIHRDLKPANVKVTPEGKVKVLDFGLAKAFEGSTGDVNLSNSPTLSMAATQAGMILGTAAYMSPEQAKGQATDKQTDIWAFGCVLFEMVCGSGAFDAVDVPETLAAVIRGEPNWAALGNVDPRLRELLGRCMAKDRRQRYRDIGDVRIELGRVRDEPPGDRMADTAGRGGMSRRALLSWGLGTAGVAGVSSVAGWSLRSVPARPVLRFDDVLPEGRTFQIGGQPFLAVSPDGEKYVYAGNDGLYLRNFDDPVAHVIPGTEELLTNPVFSPDGEWLAFYAPGDQQIKKIEVTGGTALPLAPTVTVYGLSWDDEETLLYGSQDGVWQLSAEGGEAELITPAALGAYPQRLPGHNAILFVSVGQVGEEALVQGAITVQSLDSDAPRRLILPGARAQYVSTGHLIVAGGNGDLSAVPFDLDSLDTTGAPVPVVRGVLDDHFALSDAGVLIHVPGTTAGAPNGRLTWVDRTTGTTEELPLASGPYRHPKISPDGRRLAVETTDAAENSTIWVWNLDGGSQIRQLPGGGNNYRPVWTPDSQRLTFASDRDGTLRIWWQAADMSGEAEPLTPSEPLANHEPNSWHPDGRTLAYTRLPMPRSIWTVTVDENGQPSEPEPFTGGTPGTDAQGTAFSLPDGDWLVYRRNLGPGDEQLFMSRFPRTNEPGLRVTQDSGSDPLWSPDGRTLFYRKGLQALGGELPTVLAVDMDFDGPTPDWGEEYALPVSGFSFFGGPGYDIHPDGTRFIVVFPEAPEEAEEPSSVPRVHVTRNWFEELRERVPVR